MKQELRDMAVQTAVAAPTTGWAIVTGLSIAEWIAITLGVLQGLYLLRKWWREETEWGMRLKRWAGKQRPTKPGDLEP
jgi:hypothetical protein